VIALIRKLPWIPHVWVALALCTPFLLAAYLLSDLQAAIVTFHGSDEGLYHYPAIRQFARQWPLPDVSDYSSATGPFFHLLFAAVGHWLGLELPGLRAMNVVVSCLAAYVYVRIWTDHYRIQPMSALCMALLFLSSPYFFGASFILLTDNLGWLLAMLTLYGLLEAKRTQGLWPWLGASVALCLAMLTRQTLVWLAACAVPWAWACANTWPQRAARLGMLGLACLPLGGLFLVWRGLVPPSFQVAHEAQLFINPRSVSFTLALVGAYFPLLRFRELAALYLARDWWALAALVAGLVWMTLMPIGHSPVDDGFIWRLSRSMPACLGSSLLFWGLVPLGMVAVVHMARSAPFGIGTLALAAFTLTMLPFGLLYQKYFDPFVPVFIMLGREPGRELNGAESGLFLALAAGFFAYALLPYGIAAQP
jgi:hypothetical protein